MHYIVLVAVGMMGACFVYDPTMKLLLYSALPDNQKNWHSFLLCFVEEMRFIFIYKGLAIPAWQLQVIAFDLINKNLELLLESLEKDRTYDTFL